MTDTTPPTTTTKPGSRRWLTPLLAVVAALVVGIFGGILIGHSTASATTATSQTGGFPGGGTAGGSTGAEGAGTARTGGGNFTAGTIESISGDTVTLKLTDGSTVKVKTSDSTTVTTSNKAAVSDLKAGETITVAGTTDSSGNVTATTVTEGATGFGGGRPTE